MDSYGHRPVACPDTVIATVDSQAVEYHAIRLLGHGGHGSVYELQDARTSAVVAAKVIPKAHQQLKEQQQRLQQQLSVQQVLQHKHIVRLMGSCEDSSNIYVLMEPCTCGSLEDLLQQQGPFSEQQAATVLSQVLPAVAYLHQQGVVHGDLQLSHLLLHSSGCIKLCGFGSAAQLPEGGQPCADVWELGSMLHTMLLGHPPANGSTAVQLCFPQQPALSVEAKELLAALLSPDAEQRLGLADISCHPFMLHWLGKPCSLQSSSSSSTAYSCADTPPAAAVDSCLVLDTPQSSYAADTAAVEQYAVEQYIEHLQQQVLPAASAAAVVDAAGGATASSHAVLNASWQLPPDCIAAGTWANSDSCSSSESADAGGDISKQMSLDLTSSSPQLTPESSPLPEQLLQQQHKDAGAPSSKGADQWQAEQHQHAGICLRIDAPGPSFSGWSAATAAHGGNSGSSSSSAQHTKHGQHYGLEALHELLERQEAARATCHSAPHARQQRLDQLDQPGGQQQQQQRQQAHAMTAASLAERRRSHGGAGIAVPTGKVSSGSLPELPSSFSHWGGPGQVESSTQQLKGAAVYSHVPHSDGSPVGAAAAAAGSRSGSGGSSSKVQRDTPPSPLQVPKSPRPHSMYVQSAAAAAAAAPGAAEPSSSSSSCSIPAPMPPPSASGGSFAVCASPKVMMLHPQVVMASCSGGSNGSGGSSGSGRAGFAALASPAVSPPVPMAARMHSHNLGSTGKDMAGQTQQAHAEMPRLPAAEGLNLNKPVYRDITETLHACTDAQQPAAAAQGWQSAMQQQQRREQAAGAADAASCELPRHRHDHDDSMQQQQQAVYTQSAPLLRGLHPAGAMSPAPPLVPPSPHQQQAAELRANNRRSSCGSIPASPGSRMMQDGWRPTTRVNAAAAAQSSALGMSPGAVLCVNLNALSAVPAGLDGASSYQGPGSPAVRGFLLKPMPDEMLMEGYAAALPRFGDADMNSGGSGEVNPQLAELVNASGFGSTLGAAPMPTRAKLGNFGMHTHQQQQPGMTSLGSGGFLQLNRPSGFSDHGLSSMGSGGVLEQGVLSRPGRHSDLGVPSAAGSSSSSNLGRLSGQGTAALGSRDEPSYTEQQGAANLKVLAQSVLPSKQQQQHAAAARPPLHHAHSMHGQPLHDGCQTPKGSALAQLAVQRGSSTCQPPQQLDQQQQGARGRGLRRSLSEDQQQLTPCAQQQAQSQPQPVPPREQQPVCRSPAVNMRALAPGPAFLPNLQPHICSPVPEQQQQQLLQQTPLSSSSSGNYRQLLQLTGDSDSQSSRGGTPASTPLSSISRYPISLATVSGGSAAAALGSGRAGSSGTGRPDNGAAQIMQQLPKPAFHDMLNMGMDTRPVAAPMAAPGSSSCSPIDAVQQAAAAATAASLSDSSQQPSPQQQQQQHMQPSSPHFERIQRSISTPVAGSTSSSTGGAVANDAATGHPSSSNLPRSVSSGGAAAAATAAAQGQSYHPHPPTSALGGLLSPRAGFQIPGVQGSANAGVQPVPPHSSQPPAPSPSVRARAAHGTFVLSQLPHIPHQYTTHQQQTGSDALAAGSGSGSGTHTAAAAAAPHRRYSASAADVHHHPPGSGSSGAAAASSSAGHTKHRSRSAAVDAKAWGESCLLILPDDDGEGQCELQLEASSKSAADAEEGSCSTPNMDWPADAPALEPQQQQAEQEQQQQQSADMAQPRDVQVPDSQQGSAGSRQAAGHAAAGVADQSSVGASAGSSSSSRVSVQQRPPQHKAALAAAAAPAGAADAADHAAAAAGGHVAGCPGWASPVVAAFAHCKGRLGYLMSSGVVGVVFEDSTHMFVRSSDGRACYHEHGDSSTAAAGPGIGPAALVLPGSGSPAAAATGSKGSSILDSHMQQQYRRSSDTGRSDPSALKDQDSPVGSCPAAAAPAKVEAAGSPLAAAPAAAAVTFLLPGCSSPGPASSAAADGSTSSSNSASSGVPEHLAGKARCLRRFVGCLLHHRPYSSSCQPDITRLPFPVAGKGSTAGAASTPSAAAAADVQHEGQLHSHSSLLHVGVPHLRSFVHREGCLHLKITDGCHQFVFTGDNSVLLLDAQCSQLAYVTHSQARRSSRHQAAAGAAGTAAETAAAAGMAHVQVLPLGRGAAAAAAAPPTDARLLARIAYASKLVRALQLPASWLEAVSSSSANVSPVAQ